MLLPCLRSDFSIQPRTTIQPPEQRSPPTLMQLHNIPVAVLRCNPQSCQSILVCCIFALSPIRMELRSIEPSQSHMGFMAFMCPMTHMHCSILLEVKGLKFKVWGGWSWHSRADRQPTGWCKAARWKQEWPPDGYDLLMQNKPNRELYSLAKRAGLTKRHCEEVCFSIDVWATRRGGNNLL